MSINQHGFKPNSLSTRNLLETYNFVYRKLDNGLPIDIITIDFAKAFDKVNVAILIKTLESIGISRSILKAIWLLLYDRRQVRLGNAFSDLLPITSGVPQWSILSPLLYI